MPLKKRKLNPSERSVGRPRFRPETTSFSTKLGLKVHREVIDISLQKSDLLFDELSVDLNTKLGCLFESAYEYPGRYARWSMGFKNPPIVLEGYNKTRMIRITALNERGKILLNFFKKILDNCEALTEVSKTEDILSASVKMPTGIFSEENRSRQNSLFSVVRDVIDAFSVEVDVDPQLGLYGAFGYDLTFQFESVKLKLEREENQRDIVLFLPDEILVHDKQLSKTWKLCYDFEVEGKSTKALPREGKTIPLVFDKSSTVGKESDHVSGEYAENVRKAKAQFKLGNLFEVVLSQTFQTKLKNEKLTPSEIFRRVRLRNPSPYLFHINLGENEFLVGASPEMFVRAEKTLNEDKTGYDIQIESCPISGTIKRGKNALEDADRIKEILSNKKEESELTMCTDVDRNDKSRICQHGSVRVVGRRQIEKYSALIHTVDHVVGTLRTEFDALDAFLVHTWAVTVTGAPKQWAIQFVENNEKSARRWYGGAVGFLGFDGTMNTGMTLRTIRIKDGVAEIRAGATLLFDSDPDAEEKETELKASAFRQVLKDEYKMDKKNGESKDTKDRANFLTLVIDHEDSFVNTLSSYVRELGVKVVTLRHNFVSESKLEELKPNLVLMSPGPGCPKDFNCSKTISLLIKLKIPIFGVCLGLQAIVEHFGGKLSILDYPMHGKPTMVQKSDKCEATVFAGLSNSFSVGRYHSLYATEKVLPKELRVLGKTIPESVGLKGVKEEPIIMGVQHETLPIAGVQFHPESIMTNPALGLQILKNAVDFLKY